MNFAPQALQTPRRVWDLSIPGGGRCSSVEDMIKNIHIYIYIYNQTYQNQNMDLVSLLSNSPELYGVKTKNLFLDLFFHIEKENVIVHEDQISI